MRLRRGSAIAALVVGVALFAVTVVGVDSSVRRTTNAAASSSEPLVAGSGLDGLQSGIEQAQQRLDEVPGDWTTWASLGVSYVEQGRISADPSYYPRAEGALERSLEVKPSGNDVAMTGLGALANARHDFAAAETFARRALEINEANRTSWGVLADALTQLGDYDGATEAVQRMLDLRPGLASLTRASYDLELHGDINGARATLERALQTTNSSAGRAWVQTHLGLLAFNNGELEVARDHYLKGLALVPDDPTLLAGMARVEAARGEVDRALDHWEAVVAARPLPEHLAEYATFLMALGREDAAEQQLNVYDAVQQIFEENGVADDLTAAHLEADFGDPEEAVTSARRERDRRHNIESADALAWALHAAGHDRAALPLAQEATALGGQSATFLYHRGMIEAALGHDDDARESLTMALDTNPQFSPLHAPRAREALDQLEDP